MSQSRKFPPTLVNANTLQGHERALKACAGGVAKTSGKQDPPSHLSYNYYTSTSAVWNIMHECSNHIQHEGADPKAVCGYARVHYSVLHL